MNKQLHEISPVLSHIGKLGRTDQSGKFPEAFIIEPRDLVPFVTAWDWQKCWQNKMLKGNDLPQAVWLLQHSNCYTLGRGGSEDNLRFDPNQAPFDLYRIDRGGEVTYHLPGQLVAYLVIDLRRHRTDLHWYLRQLEAVVLDVLEQLGLHGERRNGFTGVWLEGQKVASIGVSCRRWVTQHGLALNVDCDLKGFDAIVPCGLSECSIGKLDSWVPGLTVKAVQPLLKRALGDNFGFKWIEQEENPRFL